MKRLIYLVLFALSGCMTADLRSTGHAFDPVEEIPDGQAVAYFYTMDTRGGNSCLLVVVEGNREGCMGYPGYLAVLVAQGDRKIAFAPNAPIKMVNAKFEHTFVEGRSYYFEFRETLGKYDKSPIKIDHFNAFYKVRFGWVQEESPTGLGKLSNLRVWR